MLEYRLHRWEYDWLMMQYRCVPAFGPVSSERCSGCDALITDEELYRALDGDPPGILRDAMLNILTLLKEAQNGPRRE